MGIRCPAYGSEISGPAYQCAPFRFAFPHLSVALRDSPWKIYWKRVNDENPLSRHHWIHWLTRPLKRRGARMAPKNTPTAMANFFISNYFPMSWFFDALNAWTNPSIPRAERLRAVIK